MVFLLTPGPPDPLDEFQCVDLRRLSPGLGTVDEIFGTRGGTKTRWRSPPFLPPPFWVDHKP